MSGASRDSPMRMEWPAVAAGRHPSRPSAATGRCDHDLCHPNTAEPRQCYLITLAGK